ncbi:hypothetical protein QQF64_004189 [Cirrhinus molitorella]|uniref:Uncharacterized protein n=2 Tax=Cirrhinus molitorella TaxID=172907 RepID=A0ABR3MIJ3_9TELE|nr:hypothetical protein Q8A67_021064 [Cirrhinus molitorella]
MSEHARYCSAFCFIFTIDCLLVTCVKAQEPSSDEPEIKYAIIGAGIGFIFSVCFLLIKLYIIRKQAQDTELSDTSFRRASARITDVESRRA